MRHSRRGTSLASLLLILACPFLAIAVHAQTSGQTQTRRALLIGVNEYRAVPSLQGSLNDIAAMQEVLVTRWGFARAQVRTLSNSAATRTGILAALNQLVREAQPNDLVYFHYSGHGSQVEDLNGDEEDGLDETLVPHDGRTEGVADITDDELDALLDRLRSTEAIVVLDSCHSGTATRALDIRTRSLPRDTRTELYPKTSVQTRAVVPLTSARHIVMSAAASNQEALDGPVDGRYHGFFTYALARSIGAAPANASPRDVFAGVAQQLNRIKMQFGRASMPEPQLEGPPERLQRPLVPPAGGARIAWLEVQLAGTELRLARGAALGATPGSSWSIYGPGETQFAPGRALASASVTRVAGSDAFATIRATSSAGAAIPAGARAVPALPPPGAARVAIRVRDVPPDRRREIEAILARDIRNVSLVGPGEPAQFVVDMVQNDVRLSTADGLQVIATFGASVGANAWSASLAREVSRISTAAELMSLDNPAAVMRVMARVANAPAAGLQAVPFRLRYGGEPRSSTNSLQLEIAVSADAYITVVDVDSEGRVNLLFPNSYQRADFLPEGFVRGSGAVRLPDDLADGNRAGFHWDYGPPAGVDTIRVFASADLQLARLLRQRIAAMQGGTVTRGTDELRADLAGVATRGIVTVASSPAAGATSAGQPAASSGDWAATTVTVLVSE